MKRLILAVVLAACSFSVIAKGNSHTKSSTVNVKGHTTKAGTYVAPHLRTAPDHSKLNNWSTKGNVNPYTGKAGTHDPDAAH